MSNLTQWEREKCRASFQAGSACRTQRRELLPWLIAFLLFLGPVRSSSWAAVNVVTDDTGSVIAPTNFTASSVDSGMVFGQEYLSRFHSTIMAGTPPSIVFSGDSTTEGTAISDHANNSLSLAVQAILLDHLPGVQCVNAGHSGMSLHQWLTNYLALDLAQAPDLYVLRWGLNPNLESTFELDLREGLSRLRAAYPVESMSVVLMTPNTSNDAPNGRDRAYLDTLNPILRRAAREFKCVFIDLARMYPDAFSDSTMMDAPYGDARRLHPRDVFNQSIASLITEVVLPRGVANYGSTRFQNLTYSQRMPRLDTPPYEFSSGITMQRAILGLGWPLDGAVITERQADGIWRQVHYAFSGPEIRTRTGGWGGWNSWGDGIVVNPASSDPVASTISTTTPPEKFPSGLSLWPASTNRGWVHAGSVVNLRQSDGASLQINAGTVGPLAMRTGGSGTGWNAWNAVASIPLTAKAPIAVPGAASGSNPIVQIEGTDLNGTVTIVTGDNMVAGQLLTVRWSSSFQRLPRPILAPANAPAATLQPAQQVFIGSCDTTLMTLVTGGAPLAPRTIYQWNYMIGAEALVPSHPGSGERPRIAERRDADGSLGFVVFGTLGGRVVVETSTDLQTWTSFQTIVLTSTPSLLDLTAAPSGAYAFFRVRTVTLP